MSDDHSGKNTAELLITKNMIDRSHLNSLRPWPLTQQPKYAHNHLNRARNGLGIPNTLRNHMSHMKFKETAKKFFFDLMLTKTSLIVFIIFLGQLGY